MLDSHERIAIPHETGFMRAYNASCHPVQVDAGAAGRSRLGWPREEFDEEHARSSSGACSCATPRARQGALGEKTPSHTWHITRWRGYSPTPCSSRSCATRARRWPRTCGALATPGWGGRLRTITSTTAQQGDRPPGEPVSASGSIVLRYEDLLLQTEPLMRELLRVAGRAVVRQRAASTKRAGPGRRRASQVEGQTGPTSRSTRRGSRSGRRRSTHRCGAGWRAGSPGSASCGATTSPTRWRSRRCATARCWRAGPTSPGASRALRTSRSTSRATCR